MRHHGDEERLRQLSRMGDAQACCELVRVNERRGVLFGESVVEEHGPETFTTFFLRGVQRAIERLNGPQTVPFQFSGGVVGLPIGGHEMRFVMESFLRHGLPATMAKLMTKRPDPGIPARFGHPWQPSPNRQREAYMGLRTDEFRLFEYGWNEDCSHVRAEYRSTLFYALDELHLSAVRHTPQRWDLLTLWIDFK